MSKKDYKEIISVIDEDLKSFEIELTKGLKYPDSLLFELMKAPAKRIRPVLAILFLKMFGERVGEQQYNLLTAVELAHTASLIHDDIIDFDNKRRGLDTISARFGDKIGVLTGDYLLSVALKRVTCLNNNEITQNFLKTFSEMAQGEINQFFVHGQIPTLVDYIEKTKAKTAGLFCAALVNSAKLANLDIEIAREIGENFGIAFQIKNDFDNVLTSQSDIKNGVYTAPVIFSNSIEITQEGMQKTRTLIFEYLTKAKKVLENCPSNKYNRAIGEIFECLMN